MLSTFFKRVKKFPKKFLIIGVLVIALIAQFLLRPQPSQGSEFVTVKRENISTSISAAGILTGKDTVNLSFAQGGRLAFMNVKIADKVAAGQTIAGLDAQAFNIQLQQAQNTLRDKQATADKVLDDIHLFQYGNGGFANVGTASETQTQRQLRTTAEVARDNAFDGIKLLQRSMQDLYITAPFAGIVIQANVFPGQFIGPSNLIAQIVDNSQTFFDAEVDQADISKIEVGQLVEVALDAYPEQVFKGKVNQIIPQTKTTSTQSTVVVVRVLLEPVPKFIVGLQGQASIIIGGAQNALVVPIEAVVPDQTVVVKTAEGLQTVKVKTGLQSDTGIQILEGLQEGQEIVLNPTDATLKKQRSSFRLFLRR